MRSVTGRNLKRILLLTNERKFDEITDADIDKIMYAEMKNENSWRVPLIQEIMDMKFGKLIIDGFSSEECEEILQCACTS